MLPRSRDSRKGIENGSHKKPQGDHQRSAVQAGMASVMLVDVPVAQVLVTARMLLQVGRGWLTKGPSMPVTLAILLCCSLHFASTLAVLPHLIVRQHTEAQSGRRILSYMINFEVSQYVHVWKQDCVDRCRFLQGLLVCMGPLA